METVVAPAVLGIAVAAWPGAALAVQLVGLALAVAPALVLGARAARPPASPDRARAARPSAGEREAAREGSR